MLHTFYAHLSYTSSNVLYLSIVNDSCSLNMVQTGPKMHIRFVCMTIYVSVKYQSATSALTAEHFVSYLFLYAFCVCFV